MINTKLPARAPLDLIYRYKGVQAIFNTDVQR